MFRIGGVRARSWGNTARRGGAVVACLAAFAGGCRQARRPTEATTGTNAAPLALKIDAGYSGRQLSFEPNRGQADAQVNFLARGSGYSLALQPTRAIFALSQPRRLEARTQAIPRPRIAGKTSICRCGSWARAPRRPRRPKHRCSAR